MNQSFTIPPRRPPRLWWQSVLILLLVLCAGYASRRYAHYLPMLIRKRTGDALWATAVFCLLTLFRPRWPSLLVATVALAIAFSVEFSQIYHAPWIDQIRRTWLGSMILGTTFFWWDQAAYIVGVACIVPVDYLRMRMNSSHSRNK